MVVSAGMPIGNGNLGPRPEVTTVFVGNITDKASDTLIRQILMKCGNIISWKRVQGANGRLQGFGFCEYSDPEAALRAMRLLSGFHVADKKLLVKVDSKTREQLDKFKEERKIEKEIIAGHSLGDYDIEEDEDTKSTDSRLVTEIEKLMRNHASENGNVLHNYKKTHSGNTENLQGLDMNDDTKSLVAKEIRGFRQTYKDEKPKSDRKDGETSRDRDRETSRDRDREKSRDRERDRESDREKERQREKERDADREKERQREKDKEKERKERELAREKERDREKEREREREKERERRRREREERDERERDRDREGRREREGSSTPSRSRRSRSRDRDEDDQDSKRMDRIRRDKENFYMEKLKEWEARERKKVRDYEKIMEKDSRRNKEEKEEKHRLREFLEDYDDEKDDIKYYKSSALARRMRDRELEIQSDARDKQREMEEIEEVLRKQLAGETIETRSSRKQTASGFLPQHNHQSDKENENSSRQSVEPANPNLRPAAFSTVQSEDNSPTETSPARSPSPIQSQDSKPFSSQSSVSSIFQRDDSMSPTPTKKFGFGMKIGTNISNKNKLGAVFSANEDETCLVEEPKKKLSRLEETTESAAPGSNSKEASVDDKRKMIKNLIEKIPTGKEELFQYELKWDIVDEALVDKRIKPWINKKIFEYIGEEEQTLVDFICSKVLSKCNAKDILEDVAMVLDDESEVFVVKMWRLLIYETEAKKLGLVK